MAGEVASLLLSRMTVPIAYYLTHRQWLKKTGLITAEAGGPS
jgi:hypothetical protein